MTQPDPNVVSTEPNTGGGSGRPSGRLGVLMSRPAHVAGAGLALVLCLLVAVAAFGGVRTSGRSGVVGLATTNNFAHTGQLTGVDLSLDRESRPAEPGPSGTSEGEEPVKEVLAFHRDQMIWVSDADGTNARQVSAPAEEWSTYFPAAWLPDGRVLGLFRDVSAGAPDHVDNLAEDGSRQPFTEPALDASDSYTWVAGASVAPNGKWVATIQMHADECRSCVYKGTAQIHSLPQGNELQGRRVAESSQDGELFCDVDFGADSDALYVLVKEPGCGEDSDAALLRYPLDRSGDAASAETVIEEEPIQAFSVGRGGEIAVVREGHVFVRDGGREDDLGGGVDVEFSTDGSALYVTQGEIGGNQSIWLVPRDDRDGARLILENASTPVVGTVPETGEPEEPEEPDAFVLGIDGIAGVPFGVDGDEAVDRLTAKLDGTVEDDTVDTETAVCEHRNGESPTSIRWVKIALGDTTIGLYMPDDIFTGYSVQGSDPRFRTTEGAGLGSTESDLRRVYGDRIDVFEDALGDEGDWLGRVGDEYQTSIIFGFTGGGPVDSVETGILCGE